MFNLIKLMASSRAVAAGSGAESGAVQFFTVFLVVLVAVMGIAGIFYFAERQKLKRKYPHLSYARAQQIEQFKQVKQALKKLLQKQYPQESLFRSYRRLAQAYKFNRSQGEIVNPRGWARADVDTSVVGFIPLYVLLFNSPYTPLDFSGYRVSAPADSSGCAPIVSGCGSDSSSDSGCGSSGCGGGGCGGGGCGGCGS